MMRRDIYNNIVKAARLLSLVVLMAFGVGLKGWGKAIQPNSYQLPDYSVGQSTEDLYVNPNENYTIVFQHWNSADNLNGYIRWYVKNGTTETTTKLSGTGYTAYDNGLVWFGTGGTTSSDICKIIYKTGTSVTVGDTVICEASSIMNYTRRNVQNDDIASTVTVRRKYVIKDASTRRSELKKLRTQVKNNYNGWLTDTEETLPTGLIGNTTCFKEVYTVYSPLDVWTNYRLAETLSNYRIGTTPTNDPDSDSPQYVRWRIYKSDGSKASGSYTQNVGVNGNLTKQEVTTNDGTIVFDEDDAEFGSDGRVNPPNVLNFKFNTGNKTTRQIFYVTAEVSTDDQIWYPVSFITVCLEPNASAMTQAELNVIKDETDDRYERTSHYLGNSRRYKLLDSLTFDIQGELESPTAQSNYPETGLEAESYYAYAAPHLYTNRRRYNRFAGRGEYGLYKSLNIQNVSPTSWNGSGNIIYNAWFASNQSWPIATAQIYDRLHEQNSDQYGYFLFVDAADEPGVITKLRFSEQLCANTQLCVTAWIMNMNTEESTSINADVGFTFKGVRSDGTEDVLHKFYSGEIANKITNGVSQWNQVYFKFNYTASNIDYSYYILELANNSRHSKGADYAVDDIRIYRSLPDIEVVRLDACEADSLTVSSDYHTLLRNMAYSENSTTVTDWNSVVRRIDSEDGSEIIDVELLKYRLGLNGANDQNNFLRKETFDSYIFNSYFSFVEGLDDSRPDAETHDITSIDPTILGSEELDPILLGPTDRETGADAGKDVYRWVRINKDLKKGFDPRVVFSYRTIVTTRAPQVVGNNVDNYPSTHEEAVKWERVFNLRALQDYIYLRNSTNWNSFKSKLQNGSSINQPTWLTEEEDITIPDIIPNGYLTVSDLSKIKDLDPMTTDEANAYDDLMKTFWSRLDIPRIRVPWYDKDNDIMYLYTVDVRNTDLKSQGELVIEQDGTQKEATGQYHVVLQSASAIASGIGRDLNLKHICTLISPFTLYGSIQITVEAETDLSARACAGTQRKISAQLLSKDDGEPLKEVKYSFDWFLGGGYAKYWEISVDGYDLKSMLALVRTDEFFSGEITYANVNSWDPADGTKQAIRDKLLELLNPEDAKLVTNKTEFSWLLSADSLVAMPFVTQGAANTSYCTEITAAPVPLYSTDVPELHPGFTLNGITYPFKGEVSLRLGHPNMGSTTTGDVIVLNVPLRDKIVMAGNAAYLGLAKSPVGDSIMLNDIEAQYPGIGLATSMKILKNETSGIVSIRLLEKAKKYLQEGQRYELLIPFVQYDNNGPLDSECDGLISLPVKIVPEYLTWKDEVSDNWYDESNWNQSTKNELYFEGWNGTGADTDANGSDDVKKAFSPLYFTKITIPEETELALKSLNVSQITVGSKTYDVLNSWTSEGDGSDSIRYEMAVDANGDIVPYYINKVSEIYFKPEATLMNQHYLDYQKAWVDFEMEVGQPYWMSAPLKGVYAGDMYAPSSNGRQETEAFTDITYSGKNEKGTTNSRWSPAFYQKAWDKAIRYAASDEDNDGIPADDEIANVNAVKSNWSIEYNDVTVPYSLGKGFYSKVEKESEGNVLVRLPKADTEYKYETKTRALTDTGKLPGDYGRLADGSKISIDLSKEDTETTQEEVDGDGMHFLVGNPYMGYLKMTGVGGFLTENSDVLENKFWTLDRTNGSIVVSTPDVTNWDDANGVHTTADEQDLYVAPMTAFFVELKDGDVVDKTIEFTTAMMAAKPTTTDNVYTKSYSASNPILTLTAERGETRSVARLLTSDKGHDEYEASEDAVLLLDSELDAPMVYTVAGDVAAQFNTMQSIKNVPLGVYNKEGDEVTLTISGLSRLVEPLYLYDAWTGKSKELTGDSYQLTVEGESLGRYYLRNEALASELESTISIYSFQPGEIVAASSGAALRQVRVYSVNGELVTLRSAVGQTACRLSVPRGAIYMIYAEDTKGNSQSVKLRVR